MTEREEEAIQFELMAYVDGQLAEPQRIEVEEYLSRHPELAAQVMAEISVSDSLRLAKRGRPASTSVRNLDASCRLERALVRRRAGRLLQWPIALAAFAGIGWVAHGGMPVGGAAAEPSLVDDAVMAHRTAKLRAGMRSQVETAHLDKAEIERAAHVRIPALPGGWRVIDVQLFPSHDGPGVQVAVDPPGEGGALSLFAVRSDDEAPAIPKTLRRGAEQVAYWRHGDTAFALTGGSKVAIGSAALDISDNPIL
jgi:anti-sigma factor RsiW